MKMDPKTLIGLTEKKARAKIERWGMIVRIMRQDEEYSGGDCRYRTDRINLEIDNGKITKADIG